MNRILIYVLSFSAAVALMATPGVAEPSTQLLADTCAACHGTDGNSPGSIDELNDLKPGKFSEEMKEFKYEQGKGRIMGPIARGLSDEQIDALAKHFEALSRAGDAS